MQLCPVCFWEDAPGNSYWNGSNQVSLTIGQRNFAKFGACEPEHLDLVRAPLASEARPDDWISFEDSRLRILDLIEAAFREVKLEGGTTIHQREAIDDWSTEEVVNAAASKDPEVHWQDIPQEKIEKLGTSLVFLDPWSIRFHLPAFMRCSLQLWADSEYADFSHSDMLLYGLDHGPRSTGYYKHSFLLLNEQQNQAVAAYLKFIALGDSYENNAKKALAKGWADWLPHPFPFPSIS